jgi:basic amino acid/polyamine antiporter, APA family
MSIKPKLNRFDITMIVVSLVIGMGIFKTPGEVALKAGNAWIFFAAWIFGGLISLFGALTFAEIGARYPVAGGFYKVFSYCYHPSLAFMINWVAVISNAASVAAVAIVGAEYINPYLLPANLQNATGVEITSIGQVLLLYGINFLGIKMSARTQNVLTIFKMGLILILCTAIFKSDAVPAAHAIIPHKGSVIHAFGLSLVAVFFTYGGYQQTINFGGDAIKAKTNIPKGIFLGISTVIFLYLSVNFAYYKILGIGGLQGNTQLAAKMGGYIFGQAGFKIVSLLLFGSIMAYINVNILSNPRMYYAMAEDRILPPIFKHINPRTQVQSFAMSFFVVIVLLILLFVHNFGEVLDYIMFFDTIGLSLVAMSIFILRKRAKGQDETGIYTIKWYPYIPIIFILTYWFVTANIFIHFQANADKNPWSLIICLSAYASGLIIYFISTRYNKPEKAQA